jgi:hypothetical protein
VERVEEKESFRRFVVKKMLDVTCFGFFKKKLCFSVERCV